MLAVSSLAGCRPEKDEDTTPGGGGAGYVPAEAAGKWLHGTFSMSSYWTYNGTYMGNPFSQSVAFYFSTNGQYEMYYTGQTNNYGCTMDAFSFYKGFAVFTDSTFTVTPTVGRFRGYYKCSPNSNFDRAAASSELKPATYFYRYETDTNGKKWMVVSFQANDPYPSYFAQTTW